LPHTRRQRVGEILGLSIRAVLITILGIVLFGIYVGLLATGDNSPFVLSRLKAQKSALLREAQHLKNENQRLQKEYFELKQLQAGEE
jgi:hypothetical protein